MFPTMLRALEPQGTAGGTSTLTVEEHNNLSTGLYIPTQATLGHVCGVPVSSHSLAGTSEGDEGKAQVL